MYSFGRRQTLSQESNKGHLRDFYNYLCASMKQLGAWNMILEQRELFTVQQNILPIDMIALFIIIHTPCLDSLLFNQPTGFSQIQKAIPLLADKEEMITWHLLQRSCFQTVTFSLASSNLPIKDQRISHLDIFVCPTLLVNYCERLWEEIFIQRTFFN